METPKINWLVENLSLNIQKGEYIDLTDRYGVVYHRYPNSLPTATFEITGQVQWESGAWTREKADGLIPFLNEKLKEYEDEFLHRSSSNGLDAAKRVPVPGVYER